jgi:predicted protein tyrosine phosphatase
MKYECTLHIANVHDNMSADGMGACNGSLEDEVCSWNSNVMGEVQSGLFLGSLNALHELHKVSKAPGRPACVHWTIISILDSEILIECMQASLQQIIQSSKHQGAAPFSQISEPTSTSVNIHRHYLWRLSDRIGSSLFHPARVTVATSQSSHDICNNNYQDANQEIMSYRLNDEDKRSETPLEDVLTLISDSQACPTSAHYCLVHCAQGISRSTAVCCAWLIAQSTSSNYRTRDCLDRIRRVRPSVQPNLSFLADLRTLEQCRGNVNMARQRWQQLPSRTDSLVRTPAHDACAPDNE